MARPPSNGNTATRILDVAERLVQTRGFNAFSYADIAAALKVTKASLHYHFPTKADLGLQLIERYERNFLKVLGQIDGANLGDAEKLRRYVDIYSGVLRANRMCLCGMLAAEFATLPKSSQSALRHFFDANERWLAAVLDHGRADGAFQFNGASACVAQSVVATLEGALMLARSYGDAARFETGATRLLADLQAGRARVGLSRATGAVNG